VDGRQSQALGMEGGDGSWDVMGGDGGTKTVGEWARRHAGTGGDGKQRLRRSTGAARCTDIREWGASRCGDGGGGRRQRRRGQVRACGLAGLSGAG
jgi:hypothetical protein